MAKVISPYAFPGLLRVSPSSMKLENALQLALSILAKSIDRTGIEILSRSRKGELVVCRQMLLFLMSTVWEIGMSKTARDFSVVVPEAVLWRELDHSTVYHAEKNVLIALTNLEDTSPYALRVRAAYAILTLAFANKGIDLPGTTLLKQYLDALEKNRKHKIKRRISYETTLQMPRLR